MQLVTRDAMFVEDGFFQHLTPTKVVFSPNDLELLKDEVEALGRKRLLLVCGTSVRKSVALKMAQAALGERLVGVFDHVIPHSSPEIVDAGVGALRETKADCVVSIGGGSSIDTAKCMILLHAEGGTLEEHRVRFEPPDRIHYKTFTHPMLPHIAIPTTFSGAEVNAGAGIRVPTKHMKYVFSAPQLCPRVAFLSPVVTVGLPADLVGGSAMNCLAHAVEALYSRNHQPISDALAIGAIEIIFKWLPKALTAPDDWKVRGWLLIASAMAGLAVVNAKVAVHHAMCHVIGAYFGVLHGFANAVMLPHAMEFNLCTAREPLEHAARAMGREGSADAAIEGVRELAVSMGLPRRLRDIGVPREPLAEMAESAFNDRDVYYNPRRITDPKDILNIYEAAW